MQIVLPTWLGSFYGCDFTLNKYEVLTVNAFGINNNELESSAFENRWFDYQRLHPLQSCYYLAKVYSSFYTHYYKKYFGNLNKTGMSSDNFLDMREANAFWKLRRFCDLNGYEYKWFIQVMMDYRLSSSFKNRIPRPCHLLPQDDEIQAVKTLWDNYTNGDVLVKATDPFYLTVNWRGEYFQQQYERFLVSQVAKKRIKRFALHDLIYNVKTLRIEAVAIYFPEELNDILRINA